MMSGLGRKLGCYGTKEFLETETVQMRIGQARENNFNRYFLSRGGRFANRNFTGENYA